MRILLPAYGTGHETYFVESDRQSWFVKLGAITQRYQILAELGLSPQVITCGHLEDGTSILVQQRVTGRKPSRNDFYTHWQKFALTIQRTHHCKKLQQSLPQPPSSSFRDAGLRILSEVQQRWMKHAHQLPQFAGYINEKIAFLKTRVERFSGYGLVASHNDVCNGNWIVTLEGNLYLLDLDSMSMDDPALDLGAILWWYYPPEMRRDFLNIAGYPYDEKFSHRMNIRMAIHNLNIILPRDNSFDRLTIERFEDVLEDFRAVIDGQENPKGYTL